MKNIIMQTIIFLLGLFCFLTPSLVLAGDSNLILNPGLETGSGSHPLNWSSGRWGKNTGKFSYPVEGYNSFSAVKINITGYITGDAKWFFSDVPVIAGQIYTFSDMYNSDVDTSVTVRYKLSDGTYNYSYLGVVPKSIGWQKFTTDLTVPQNVVSLTIFHMIKKVGYLSVDDASLTVKSSLPPLPIEVVEVPLPNTDGNLVINPGLEASNGSVPTNWIKGGWGNNVSNYSYPVVGYNSVKAAKINVTSYTSGDSKWFFDDILVTGGQTYTFSDMYNSDVDTDLTVRFKLADGSYSYDYLGTSPKTIGWEKFSADIIVPENVVSLTIFHVISSIGYLTIDDVSLLVKKIETPTPIVDGNLVLNSTLEISNGSSPKNWVKGGWGNNISKYSYPVVGYNSSNSAKVEVISHINGDAKWSFDDVTVTPGKTYKFSDMYISDVDTFLNIRYKLSDGSYVYDYLATVPKSTTWTEFSTMVTIPQNVVSLTVFHLINKVGYLTIDNSSVIPAKEDVFTEGMVTLSFDDGYKNIYDFAIPILDKVGIKSTQAIVTNTFDYPDFMTKENIKSIYDNGHEIASHTISHAHLTELTLSGAKEEIVQSKADLASYGVNASTFVYPYGEYNSSTIDLIKQAGYVGARSVNRGYNTPTTDKYQLQDQEVTSDATFETIKGYIDTAIADKKWLILEMHEQGDNLGFYSNTINVLQNIVDYIKLKNVKTVTLGQGISNMK